LQYSSSKELIGIEENTLFINFEKEEKRGKKPKQKQGVCWIDL